MADGFATRSDWLPKAQALEGYEILTIHPLDGLTGRMVADALDAQKILYSRRRKPNFVIRQHGSKILIQRSDPEGSTRS